MMPRTPGEFIHRAGEIGRDAVLPFVVQSLERRFGTRWKGEVKSRLRDTRTEDKDGNLLLDRYALCKILLKFKYDLFGELLPKQDAWDDINTLLTFRNDLSHDHLLNHDDASKMIVTSITFLRHLKISGPHLEIDPLIRALRELDRECKGAHPEATEPLLENQTQSIEVKLPPLDFKMYAAEKAQGFVGREWLFEKIDLWRFDEGEKGLMLVGDPGTGKSAFLAELVRRNPDQSVAAHFFCQAGDSLTLLPSRFVRTISKMLEATISGYGKKIGEKPIKEAMADRVCEDTPSIAFRDGVLGALSSLQPPENQQTFFLVVDSLDEAATSKADSSIADILASSLASLPPWMRLITTTRRDGNILQKFPQCRRIDLDIKSAETGGDIHAYINARLQSAGLAEKLRADGKTQKEVMRILEEKSDGNFLYVKNALIGVDIGSDSFARLPDLPRGLDGSYRNFLRRLFSDSTGESFSEARPLIEALIAAREPLSLDEFAEVAERNLNADFLKLVQRLEQILSCTESTGRMKFSLCHPSWRDWLTAETLNEFFVSKKQAEKRLADYCRRAFERGLTEELSYASKHCIVHWIAAQEWELVTERLSDCQYLSERIAREGMETLAAEYALAIRHLPNTNEAATQIERMRSESDAQQESLDRWSHAYAKKLDLPKGYDAASKEDRHLPAPPTAVPLKSWAVAREEARRLEHANEEMYILRFFRDFCRAPYSSHKSVLLKRALERFPSGRVFDLNARYLPPEKDPQFVKEWESSAAFDSQNPVLFEHPREDPGYKATMELSLDGRFLALTSGRKSYGGELDELTGDLSQEYPRKESIGIWNLETHQKVGTLKTDKDWISKIRFSPDGKYLLTLAPNDSEIVTSLEVGYEDLENGFALWDWNAGDIVQRQQIMGDVILDAAFPPGGERLVLAMKSGEVLEWNLVSKSFVRVAETETLSETECESIVGYVCLSTDGSRLVKSIKIKVDPEFDFEAPTPKEQEFRSFEKLQKKHQNFDRRIRIWSTTSGKCIHELSGHEGDIKVLSLSYDNSLLLFSEDDTLYLWNLKEEKLRPLGCHDFPVEFGHFSADAKRVVSIDKWTVVKVWDVQKSECRMTRPLSFTVHMACIRADAESIIVTSAGSVKGVRLLVASSEESPPHLAHLNSAKLSFDNRFFVTSDVLGRLQFWDIPMRSLLDSKPIQKNYQYRQKLLQITSDGRSVVTGALSEKTLNLWSLPDAEFIGQVQISPEHIAPGDDTYLWTKDERILIIIDFCGVEVFDFERCRMLKCLKFNSSGGQAYPPADLSPDGVSVAFCEGEENVCFWNWETGELFTIRDHREGTWLRYSPDGRRLYVELFDSQNRDEKDLAVFDTRTFKEVRCAKIRLRHLDVGDGCEISPDGRWLLSTSGEFVKLTNLQTFEQTNLPIIANTLGTMHWASLRFFSGTEDGRIQQWRLKNIELGPFITTARRTIVSEDKPAIEHRIRPLCCGKTSPLPEQLEGLINTLQEDDTDERFDDSGLLISCPNCGWPLKLNPFFMDIYNYADFLAIVDSL